MDSDSLVYFGYGSLVNRDTRPAGERAVSARLSGWRRVWEHQGPVGNRRSCSLSVEPAPLDEGIDGVLVHLPLAELPQLDERETGYDRLMLPGSGFELVADTESEAALQNGLRNGPQNGPQNGLANDLRTCLADLSVAIYRSRPECRAGATEEAPLLQSYVDCVMAGYLQRFGDKGLNDFLHSTRGWDVPMALDRAQPRYPRAVSPDARVLRVFDQLLEGMR